MLFQSSYTTVVQATPISRKTVYDFLSKMRGSMSASNLTEVFTPHPQPRHRARMATVLNKLASLGLAEKILTGEKGVEPTWKGIPLGVKAGS
jgi:hypothetical protein